MIIKSEARPRRRRATADGALRRTSILNRQPTAVPQRSTDKEADLTLSMGPAVNDKRGERDAGDKGGNDRLRYLALVEYTRELCWTNLRNFRMFQVQGRRRTLQDLCCTQGEMDAMQVHADLPDLNEGGILLND